MPQISDNALLKKAIPYAVLDRQSLAESYDWKGQWAEEAIAVASRVKALAGKRLDKLSGDELKTAFLAFLFAQQWLESLADALASGKDKVDTQRLAIRMREARIRRWGKTELEMIIDGAQEMVVPAGRQFGEVENR